MAFNILVVDDSRTTRAMIIKTLTLARVPANEIFQAANGAEGLSIMREKWIDIVFADINMPVMTGIEMIEAMRGEELLRKIPVVIVSAQSSGTAIDHVNGQGVKAFIRKPFTPEHIRHVAAEILGVAYGTH